MTSPTQISSSSQFEKTLTTHKVVVVDFYADWCGPCKAIAPAFNALCATESKPGRVMFCKVDVDSQREVASKYGVTAMPTFIIFQNGSVKQTVRGANASALSTAVKAAIASAGAGGAGGASFQSKGHVLGSGGASGPTRSAAGGSGSASFELQNLVPGGFLGAIVRFVGLYFTTLLTLDPKDTAETSPFRVSADPTRPQARSVGRL